MERNVSCRAVPGTEPKLLICCAAENKKNKINTACRIYIYKSSDEKPEFFLFGLNEERCKKTYELPTKNILLVQFIDGMLTFST